MTDFDEVQLLETRAGKWCGEPRWGSCWMRQPGNNVPGYGGIGTNGRITVGEYEPSGAPCLYEVRFHVVTGAIDPTWAPGAQEGIVHAVVTSSVGKAKTVVEVDVGSGMSVVVPGGRISVDITQSSAKQRFVDSIAVAICRAFGARSSATNTVALASPTVDPGIPNHSFQIIGIPARATALRVFNQNDIPAGGGGSATYAQFFTEFGIPLGSYSAADGLRSVVGVPVPPSAWAVMVSWPTLATVTLASFVIG